MSRRGYDDEDGEQYEDLQDEEELEDEEDDDRGRKRKNAFIDDAAEEDEEDDEEDDRYRKRRRNVGLFFDEEADVDEDEEDLEEGEDDDIGGLIDDAGEDIPEEPGYVRRQLDDEQLWSDDQLEDYIKNRFATTSYDVADEEQTGTVGQQGLLPTVQDPKLWVVEALPGQEREAVICLLQKCRNYAAKGVPLLIKSAFCQDHLKGYVYIEAFKESHVKEAISGLRVLRYGKGAQLVPIAEMVDAVSVNLNSKAGIDVGSWIRLRSGLYKGDLAKVKELDASSNRLWIQIIPRLDYTALAKRQQEGKSERRPFGRQAGASKVRPPARPFNYEEARSLNIGKIDKRGRECRLNDTMRFVDGYLIKRVTATSVYQDEGVPPLDEIQRFNAVAQASKQQERGSLAGTDDLSQLMESLTSEHDTSTRGFTKGDRVEAVDGDLKGIRGRVLHVSEDGTIEVKSDMEEIKDALKFDAKQLVKYFASGDYVKVVFGEHAGQTGLVVRVEGPICYVFADATKTELLVFAKDLTEAAQVSSGFETFGPYELHDLVVLDATTQGVIVGVDAESCRVLTNQGSLERPDVRVCKLPDIKRKINNYRQLTTQEGAGQTVKVGDMVAINEGRMHGEMGTVKFVFRSMLWVHSREWSDHGGFKCVRARSCRLRGSRGGMTINGQANLASATPYRGTSVFSASVFKSPAPYREAVTASPRPGDMMGGPGGGMGMFGRGQPTNMGRGGRGSFSGRSNLRTDMSLMGKMIKVTKGPFKGYQGRVVSATESHVRMELEAQYKTVTVKRECLDLGEHGAAGGAPPSAARGGFYGQRPSNAPPTPAHAGGRTPLHPGSATPHHAWGSSGDPTATPHWNPNRTPSHDPSRTPSRDNAWNPNYATPRHPGIGSADDHQAERGYGYNAQTPAYNAQTPAYTPAETPALTPGLDLVNPSPLPSTPGLAGMGADARYAAAPTPAAPTPATAYAAPTPGTVTSYSPAIPTPHLAPTPGSVNVNTPGFGVTPAMTPGMVAMSPAINVGGMGSSSGDKSEWIGLEVELKDGVLGVVRAVHGDGSMDVELGDRDGSKFRPSGNPPETFMEHEVKLAKPGEKDEVRIVSGDKKGQSGKLIAVDLLTGIVKLDEGVKLMDMQLLGRIVDGEGE